MLIKTRLKKWLYFCISSNSWAKLNTLDSYCKLIYYFTCFHPFIFIGIFHRGSALVKDLWHCASPQCGSDISCCDITDAWPAFLPFFNKCLNVFNSSDKFHAGISLFLWKQSIVTDSIHFFCLLTHGNFSWVSFIWISYIESFSLWETKIFFYVWRGIWLFLSPHHLWVWVSCAPA